MRQDDGNEMMEENKSEKSGDKKESEHKDKDSS